MVELNEMCEFIKFLGTDRDNARSIIVRINSELEYPVHGLPIRNCEHAAKFANNCNGVSQVYITVNASRPIIGKPKISDIMYWCNEYIDLDCEREDHSIPATAAELNSLKPEIRLINEWIKDRGFLRGYCDFTGNGYRWLLPIPPVDLRKLSSKNVKTINEQKKVWLRNLKTDTGTNIDVAVGELSRITGLPGTINVKAHDARDRRRQSFRGCDRIEDQKLLDYIISLDIPEDEYVERDTIEYEGPVADIINTIFNVDKAFKKLVGNAQSAKRGKRSNYDYVIAMRLKEYNVSELDCMELLGMYGSSKAKSKDYVKMTVKKVYLG